MGTVDDRRPFSIHNCKDPSAAFQECTVENEMARPRKIGSARWWTFQPVPDQSSDRRHTVTALLSQLPDRIAFDEPSFKTDPLLNVLVGVVPPTEGVRTLSAHPSLSSMTALSIAEHSS